jgi:NADPH2:quinone reductase
MMMRAAMIDTTGSPDVIRVGEVPEPTPGPGQVRVSVAVAGLNPIDVYIRAGTVAMPLPLPFFPASDLAGVVESVGPGVSRFRPGDRVWGSNQGLLGRQGTTAERVCVDEAWLYPIPDGVGELDAAAVALTGITAHLGLFAHARLQPGETVFVNGGTGGVGSMVVQMAKAVGAKVICTVGSAEKAELCRHWGAAAVLNYKTDDLATALPEAIKSVTGGKGLNVWYETQREIDLPAVVERMAPRGRIVLIAGRAAKATLPVGPFYVKGLSMHGLAMFNATPDEQRVCADEINRWLSEAKLHPPVGATFPLAQTAEAHRVLETNTLHGAGTLVGKVLVTL